MATSLRRQPRPQPPRRGTPRGIAAPAAGLGYSLSELLIAFLIGGVLMAGAASMLVSHTRTTARTEALIRLQDGWSRVQFLLDHDIQESIGTPTIVSCSSLALAIPRANGSTDTITYALSGSNLMRSGPDISADNGALVEGSLLSNQLVMGGVTQFCPTNVNGEIVYTLALQDPTGVVYQNQSQPSGAHPRSRIIN